MLEEIVFGVRGEEEGEKWFVARTGEVIVERLFDVAPPLITREWKTSLRLRLGDDWRLDRWRDWITGDWRLETRLAQRRGRAEES